MDDEKASSAPRREGDVTRRRARSAPPALFVEPQVNNAADQLPIEVPKVTPAPRTRPPAPASKRPFTPDPLPDPSPDSPPEPTRPTLRNPPSAPTAAPRPARADRSTPAESPAREPRTLRGSEEKPAAKAAKKATRKTTGPASPEATGAGTPEATGPTNPETTEPATPETATNPPAEVTTEPAARPARPRPRKVPATTKSPTTATPRARAAAQTGPAETPATVPTPPTVTQALPPTPPSTTPPPRPAGTTGPATSGNHGDWRSRTSHRIEIRPTQAELWAAVRTHPAFVPAALALVAVDRFGPEAARRTRWLIDTYPNVPPARLVRAAVRDAMTRGRYATAVGALPLAGILGLSTQLWAQARLVLEIAAINGHDPIAPERAADLLALLRIQPDAGQARAAIVVLLAHAAATTAEPDAAADAPGPTGRNRATKQGTKIVGLRLARRAAARWFPGSTLVFDGLSTVSATEALANRAHRYYRDLPRR